MHEATIDRQMNNTLARYHRNSTPLGVGTRIMTPEERDYYTHSTRDSFESCVSADNSTFDGVALDRDRSLGKIRYYDRQISHGDDFNTEFKSSAKAKYSLRNHSFQINTRETEKELVEGGETRSERSLVAGKIGKRHISGIEMHRQGNTFSMVQYDIDLRNPENSVIYEMAPATARSAPPRPL
jgi:hypothetical protein